jgi:pimeloyl-ACP methyl ester carboxylesterase
MMPDGKARMVALRCRPGAKSSLSSAGVARAMVIRIRHFTTPLALVTSLTLISCTESDRVAGCTASSGTAVSRTEQVDVGGFSLYVDIQGPAIEGKPTIVFDHGGGEDHTPWQTANVQQTIAQSNLTISYDRAGQGQSDESNLPKTADEQSRQLHALLHNSGMPAPYLLVSHSISGLNARVYADLFPDELHGVVFVDSSHEGMNEGEWQPITAADTSSSGEMSYEEFTVSAQQAKDARARDRLRHKPIAVLSATCHGPCTDGTSIVNEDGWKEFQNDLATLSDNSVHTTAPPGSEHHLMTTQPQMVIDGICEILER